MQDGPVNKQDGTIGAISNSAKERAGNDVQQSKGIPIPTTPICYAYRQRQDEDTTAPKPGEAEGYFKKMLQEKEEEARFSPKDKRNILRSGPF